LGHLGHGDAVVDGDVNGMLLDFQHAAIAAVGDQQTRRADGRSGKKDHKRQRRHHPGQHILRFHTVMRFHINLLAW